VTWAALSLADKLDTLVGLLVKAGEKVTGSRDPFALRRNAHGAMRILMDLPELTGIGKEIPLRRLLTEALEVHGEPADESRFLDFICERMVAVLGQRGLRVEVVSALYNASGNAWDRSPLKLWRIGNALMSMRTSDEFAALAVLFKRVKNIAKELKEDASLDRSALTEPAEQALLAELDARRPKVEQAAAHADYKRALTEIAGLSGPVDKFFTDVFVMAEDPRLRTARLTLMAELRDLILNLADISEIVPQTE
jgi:glycyl-tRNA synthetase beta chain